MRLNRTSATVAGIAILLLMTACASTTGDPSAGPDAHSRQADTPEVHMIEGYPIDRTLDGLIGWRDLDTVVVVSAESISTGKPVELNKDSVEDMNFIVTPKSAVVLEAILGDFSPSDTVDFVVAGGTSGGVKNLVSDEFAPSAESLSNAHTLVIGGQLSQTEELGEVLDPLFVYELDESGMLTSLLSSGSEIEYPQFALSDLKVRLADREKK